VFPLFLAVLPQIGDTFDWQTLRFGGVLMFIFCAVLMSGPFCPILWFSVVQFCRFVWFWDICHPPLPLPVRPRRLSVPLVVVVFLVATTFNTFLSF
jgi:hypothetical protein